MTIISVISVYTICSFVGIIWGAVKQMVIVKLEFMKTSSLIHNVGQCARIGVRFGPIYSSLMSKFKEGGGAVKKNVVVILNEKSNF